MQRRALQRVCARRSVVLPCRRVQEAGDGPIRRRRLLYICGRDPETICDTPHIPPIAAAASRPPLTGRRLCLFLATRGLGLSPFVLCSDHSA